MYGDRTAAHRIRASVVPSVSQGVVMNPFVALGLLLLAIWAVLWLGFHIVSGLIHLLVVIAVISIVWGLVKRGAATVNRNLS
jgi:hypothetical protein